MDDFCAAWTHSVQEHDTQSLQQQPAKSASTSSRDNPVWQAIRREAKEVAATEGQLSSFYHASIISQESFSRSLAFVLANRLADATLLATELLEIFHEVLRDNELVKQAALFDIVAFYERDPACVAYSNALLYFKGYHAIQAYRIAHILWTRGRKIMALALQARVSEVLAIDIHPGAVLGKGLLLDHGTGVVIGETSRVGDNVSIMQNVTLGGTGKNVGNRHPQVESNVLIGAGATVLGNIRVGKGAQVAAGSLVLKDVPPKTMVAGSPARIIGKVQGNAALRMHQGFSAHPDGGAIADGASTPQTYAAAVPQSDAQFAASAHSSGSSSPADSNPVRGQHSAAQQPATPQQRKDQEAECSDAGDALNMSSLADWAISAATRQSPLSSGGEAESHPPGSQQQPTDGRQNGGDWQQHASHGAAVGGRGGVVSALAVQPDDLLLAPECEPEWLLASAQSGLAAYKLASQRGSAAAANGQQEDSAAMWRSLRQHNNKVLTEAGIRDGLASSWTMSTASSGSAPAAADSRNNVVAAPQLASGNNSAASDSEPAAEADYII